MHTPEQSKIDEVESLIRKGNDAFMSEGLQYTFLRLARYLFMFFGLMLGIQMPFPQREVHLKRSLLSEKKPARPAT